VHGHCAENVAAVLSILVVGIKRLDEVRVVVSLTVPFIVDIVPHTLYTRGGAVAECRIAEIETRIEQARHHPLTGVSTAFDTRP